MATQRKVGAKKKAAPKKAVAKKAAVKKAVAKKAAVKKVSTNRTLRASKSPRTIPQENIKNIFPAISERVEQSSSEILEELMARIHGESALVEAPFKSFDEDSPRQSTNVLRRLTAKRHLPVLVICLLLTAIIAGFWGKQIVASIGIPVNGDTYTSLYFQDPSIVEKGVVSGDLLVFGIHNGSEKSRIIGWHVNSAPLTIARGEIKLAANADSFVQISTAGAISGEKIEVYVDGNSTPITVEVVG